jgi:ketosteroid isomerase-like protein
MVIASTLILMMPAAMPAFSQPSSSLGSASPADTQTVAGIQKTDQTLSEAFLKNDLVALERMSADTYVFTDQNGRVSGKRELIESSSKGAIDIRSQDITDVNVHVYGDTAIETGLLKTTAVRDGRDSSGTYRFTRVWARRNGEWQTFAFQETRPVVATP